MATGNVYLFNTTQNNMTLLLNSHILSSQLNGVTSSNGYAPTSVSAQRNSSSGNPGNATFGGQNTLIISFPDGTAQQYELTINPSSAPITQDLQLYMFYNQVVLVTGGNGTNVPPDSNAIQGRAVTVNLAEFSIAG